MSVGFEVMYNVPSTNAICKSTSIEQIMVYGFKRKYMSVQKKTTVLVEQFQGSFKNITQTIKPTLKKIL